MTFLLDCAIKVSVILLIAIVSLSLLRKQSAALRHGVLSAALLVAAIMPVLSLAMRMWSPMPAVAVRMFVTPVQELIPSAALPKSGSAPQPSPGVYWQIPQWLPEALWLAGLLIGVSVLVTGLARLVRVTSASRPMPDGHWTRLAARISSDYRMRPNVRLLQSRNSSILVTWGAVWPKVILPLGSSEWTEERAGIVLRHELAHVRRRDWMMQMTGQALRIVYWFNPLVWIVCRRLRLESECACDDAVIAEGVDGSNYAGHLLELARSLNQPGRAWSAAMAMAAPTTKTTSSTLERRFTAMLNPSVNRRPMTRLKLMAIVIAAIVVALPLAVLSSRVPPAAASPFIGAPAAPAPAQAQQEDTQRLLEQRLRDLRKDMEQIQAQLKATQQQLAAQSPQGGTRELSSDSKQDRLKEEILQKEELKMEEVRKQAEAQRALEDALTAQLPTQQDLLETQRFIEDIRKEVESSKPELVELQRAQREARGNQEEMRKLAQTLGDIKKMLEDVLKRQGDR